VSHAAREWAWRQNLKPIPKSVLVVLGDYANDAGVCWPRIATIADKVGVSPRTVQRAIQHLVQRGLITVDDRYRSDGSHTSNLYRLHLDQGVSVSPPPDRGDTTPGHECQGPGDTGVIPGTTIGTSIEPPQPAVPGNKLAASGGGSAKDLVYPKGLLPAERTGAQALLAALEAPLSQQVLDEWAGIIAAGAIRASPLGCLRALIKRAQAGTFTPERALRVARTRETRQRVEAAQVATERLELPPQPGNPVAAKSSR
jgi:GntR family transcriptional regulator